MSGYGFIPLSGDVDEIWHALILQTKQYDEFCKALPGRKFIHHNSISFEEYAEEETKELSVRRLLEWIPSYVKTFGSFTIKTASYWMIVQLLMQEYGYSVEEINSLQY